MLVVIGPALVCGKFVFGETVTTQQSCQVVELRSQQTLSVRKDKILHLNGMAEWPNKFTFSVSIVVPTEIGDEVAKNVRSISVAPIANEEFRGREQVASEPKISCRPVPLGGNRCHAAIVEKGVDVEIIFNGESNDKSKNDVESILDILKSQALNCPSAEQ